MESYLNIKAIQAAALTLKGYTGTVTGRGLDWSCKVYLENKKIGSVSNSGIGGMTITDVPIETQRSIVTALKRNAYTLTFEFAEHVSEGPIDPNKWFVDAITQMIDEVARLRKLKRLAKTHLIVQQKSSDNEFEFYKIVPSESSKARLRRQLGDDLICFMNDEILGL
ncbi:MULTISPECIES: hypothetical protein [Pseudomonas syringae group]|uniref:Uncharacterized protein n=3 Tax=Pseudomonas syringae group TaxID=136849 RepID=A0AAD0GUJ4_9PSED|nr:MULTISPECIES: hypothetical protein [Pseudomonas syringae group]AVB23464.1 hypothetical protein BKM03_31070 [Pseudomonas avellanae]PHN37177.1 hypothetical protein AO261_28580 [Pseudomonas avellanae]POC85187.1 hypothetical protein BKM26_22185 [Pseudomonas avellanae]POP78536.1 hypothetical protein CXB34_26670 [Pseudomonas amygdali pv. morsprunorum]POR73157.1 hypothetical protein BKM25_23060 [Pseudomonas avellanae]